MPIALVRRAMTRDSFKAVEKVAVSSDDLKQWMAAVAQQRDKAAYGRLFQYFAPRLVGFMERAGVGRTDAEEIAQDTLVSVWRKAELYDARQAAVSTWVFTIARNLRIDMARRATRRRNGAAAMGEPEIELVDSAEDEAIAGERDARVREAMKRLSREQATVLRLSFFSEKPHAEIARELGIPLGTVKSRMRLAMAKIRPFLETEL
jgi:RNA polymerase sigma-70 factor (ECF subfamily)